MNANSIWQTETYLIKNPSTISSTTSSTTTLTYWYNTVNFDLAGNYLSLIYKGFVIKIIFILEWAMYFPSQVFATQNSVIRLFDLNDKLIYGNADYFPSLHKIEINLLVNNAFNKKVIAIDPTLASITSLLITWKNPTLRITINCIMAGLNVYTDSNQVIALSIPFVKPFSVACGGEGVFYSTIREAVLASNCDATTTTTTTTTTTPTTPTTTTSATTTTSTSSFTFNPAIFNLTLAGNIYLQNMSFKVFFSCYFKMIF